MPAGASAQDKKPADEEKLVCKSERNVGSHRSTRVCKSLADWESERTNSKRTMDVVRVLWTC